MGEQYLMSNSCLYLSNSMSIDWTEKLDYYWSFGRNQSKKTCVYAFGDYYDFLGRSFRL